MAKRTAERKAANQPVVVNDLLGTLNQGLREYNKRVTEPLTKRVEAVENWSRLPWWKRVFSRPL